MSSFFDKLPDDIINIIILSLEVNYRVYNFIDAFKDNIDNGINNINKLILNESIFYKLVHQNFPLIYDGVLKIKFNKTWNDIYWILIHLIEIDEIKDSENCRLENFKSFDNPLIAELKFCNGFESDYFQLQKIKDIPYVGLYYLFERACKNKYYLIDARILLNEKMISIICQNKKVSYHLGKHIIIEDYHNNYDTIVDYDIWKYIITDDDIGLKLLKKCYDNHHNFLFLDILSYCKSIEKLLSEFPDTYLKKLEVLSRLKPNIRYTEIRNIINTILMNVVNNK